MSILRLVQPQLTSTLLVTNPQGFAAVPSELFVITMELGRRFEPLFS
jgi:hypothetical protein